MGRCWLAFVFVFSCAVVVAAQTTVVLPPGSDVSDSIKNISVSSIILSDGDYYVSYVTFNRSLTIVGQGNTILQCSDSIPDATYAINYVSASARTTSISGITFKNCPYSVKYTGKGGNNYISGCKFSNGKTAINSEINYARTLYINFSSFTNFSTCAIMSYKSEIYIDNSTFYHNARSFYVTGQDAQITATNVTVRNNTNQAIVLAGGVLYLRKSDISYNSATTEGAAIRMHDSYLDVRQSIFSFNRALQGYGGAIYTSSSATYVTECQFTNNSASEGGGAIFSIKEGVQSVQTNYSSNYARLGGALLANDTRFFNFEKDRFTSNLADFGGALYINPSSTTLTIKSCNVAYNSAAFGGGGIYAESGASITTTMSTFEYNSGLNGVGGGMAITGAGSAYITNSTFRLNAAPGGKGGGLYVGKVTRLTEIDFNLISQNSASVGGGLALNPSNSSVFILYNNITNNIGTTSHSGIYLASSPKAVVVRESMIQNTHTLYSNFCCNGLSVDIPDFQICNFPTCNECKESGGCNCPFKPNTDVTGNSALASANTTCTCSSSFYFGRFCTDHEPCGCDINADCFPINNTANCECHTGYTGNGTTCIEIDECQANNCTANSTCEDHLGYFQCVCNPGFTKIGYTCEEIDECASNNCSADASCINHVGYFECVCKYGFNGTGYYCTEIDECLSNNCSANATCNNHLGYFDCSCNYGFTGDGYNCTDNVTIDTSTSENSATTITTDTSSTSGTISPITTTITTDTSASSTSETTTEVSTTGASTSTTTGTDISPSIGTNTVSTTNDSATTDRSNSSLRAAAIAIPVTLFGFIIIGGLLLYGYKKKQQKQREKGENENYSDNELLRMNSL